MIILYLLGLSLYANLHPTFNRGLIAIDDDYRVLVSDAFEEEDCSYGIRQFAGKEILLPVRREWWPDVEKLRWRMGVERPKFQAPSSKFQGGF